MSMQSLQSNYEDLFRRVVNLERDLKNYKEEVKNKARRRRQAAWKFFVSSVWLALFITTAIGLGVGAAHPAWLAGIFAILFIIMASIKLADAINTITEDT